jgi:uncharacterized protein (UPF0332 family)
MDLQTKRAYIGIRVAKSLEDMATAQEMLKVARWRGAVNRAYYAVFHIASAALLWLDIERSKHSGVLAAFNRFLVKPGLIEVEYSQIYKDVVRPLDQATTAQMVHDAERFVARLECYLRKVGAMG